MIIDGDFVDILCDINSEHLPNFTHVHEEKLLYMEILQAICGYIESGLSWCKLYSETLQKEGFVINPYDRCVPNPNHKSQER